MKMKDVVARLHAFKVSAKLIHWKLTGSQFLELHEFMDEVAEPIDDFIDSLMERYFMAEETNSLKSIENIFKIESTKYYVEDFNNTESMIRFLLNLADEIKIGIDDINTYRGVNAILDEISSHMLKVKALLKAQLS